MSETPHQETAAPAQKTTTSSQRDNAILDILPLDPGDIVSVMDRTAYRNIATALHTLKRSKAWQESRQETVQTQQGAVLEVQGWQDPQSDRGNGTELRESVRLNVMKALNSESSKKDKIARPSKRPLMDPPTPTTVTKKRRKMTQAMLSDYFP